MPEKQRVCLAYSGMPSPPVPSTWNSRTNVQQAVSTPAVSSAGYWVCRRKIPLTASITHPHPQLTISPDEGYDVVCFLANVGQEEDWAAVEQKALKIGAEKMIIEDLRREFVTELCFPAIRMTSFRPFSPFPVSFPDWIITFVFTWQSAMPSTRADIY